MTPSESHPESPPRGVASSSVVRNVLALVTVVGFVLITTTLAVLFPLFGLAAPGDMIGYLKELSSIYSGIVGLVIGFYFGKA